MSRSFRSGSRIAARASERWASRCGRECERLELEPKILWEVCLGDTSGTKETDPIEKTAAELKGEQHVGWKGTQACTIDGSPDQLVSLSAPKSDG